jgi:PAS domain S-box-containing protein
MPLPGFKLGWLLRRAEERSAVRARSIDPQQIVEQVRGEQVRTLYRQSSPVLLANVANALIVSIALWSHASQRALVLWTTAMTLMAIARIALRRRYWSEEREPREQVRWGAYFTFGSFCAGSLWGFAGGVLLPAEALPQQLIVLLVLGGMAAAAAGTISCYMPAYFAYLVPSLLPALVRLWMLGGEVPLAMVAMIALFSGALTLVARNVNRALSQAFRLRFENAELYTQVSRVQSSLVDANAALSRANEQLETRVRVRTEELRASERRLSEIVSESPDAIVVFDEYGRILSANPAAEQISGRPAAAMVGQHFAANETLGVTDSPRAIQIFSRLQASDALHPEELRLVRPDGREVFIEMSLRVVRAPDGQRRIHSVIRDVSERHHIQQLRAAYEIRLREAERLEAVGLLAGGVAHDFNNVLTMILNNVNLLEAWGSDPDAKALLGEIRHGSLQAANLTKQLLAFSRKQVLDLKPTDLAQVVSNARSLFERALGEQNELWISLPVEPMVVLVDATQIEQAILNLLVNARHAMPQGGRVELELKRVQLGAQSDWPDVEAGSYVRLSVSDTGTGMDEATRKRVFEPFFTTKERGHGTGLGLSSVHGVVKQAGGHIRVSSQPARGTRFEIVLPSHAAPALAGVEEVDTVWTPGEGTVLVVEDQPQVRRSLTHILEEAGYNVLAAASSEEALSLARKLDGRIDLLVSDVIMPGVSGVELSRRLRGLYPDLAVLLVSGYAGDEISLLDDLGDHVQFLEKPFDAVSLTSAARSALDRSREATARTTVVRGLPD